MQQDDVEVDLSLDSVAPLAVSKVRCQAPPFALMFAELDRIVYDTRHTIDLEAAHLILF